MLKLIRKTLATIIFVGVTLLFLDFTGCTHSWLAWLAKIQFLPAVLAHSFILVAIIVVATLLFGRLYCSVICPLGVFQDGVAKLGKRGKKLPYTYSKAKSVLRYSLLGIVVIALIINISVIISILDPYAAYGRIANNIFQPIWIFGNNILASIAEHYDSYAIYTQDVWIKSTYVFVVSLITLFGVAFLAWRNGRTYCNTICPVGTLLGLISKYSLFKVRIDSEKCNKCSLCARNCKASCIDHKNYSVDASRCVSCFNCIDKCNKGAISYTNKAIKPITEETEEESRNDSRREFITTALVLSAAVAKAQVLPKQVEMKMDGGLADVSYIKPPMRTVSLSPPGSVSLKNLTRHCTACQLCVGACPNGVLTPSSKLDNFMQPEMSFSRGYCRPECNKCGEVCPAGAIKPISVDEKVSTQIGRARWIEKNCIVSAKDVKCFNCSRKCPTGAITMVENSRFENKIPIIDTEKCIGCGACENLCPARPYSAMVVDGNSVHRQL